MQSPYDGVFEANKIRLSLRPQEATEVERLESECDTDDEEEDEFHGFTPDDVDRGRSNSQIGRVVNPWIWWSDFDSQLSSGAN